MPQKKRGQGFMAAQGIPLLLMVLSIILVSISTKTVQNLPRAVAVGVSGGVQKLFFGVQNFIQRTVFSIRELRLLREEYETLTAKLESFENLERDYVNTLAENERLKEQLSFFESVSSIKAAARIIAKDPGNIYSSCVIDKGSSAGVEADMAVAAFQNGIEGLAGKVLEARLGSSLVLPLYDGRLYVAARLSRTRVEGLVNGQGKPDDPLLMNYVSMLNAQDIQIGDMVVTSGLDSIYPPDIAIGRVKEIRTPKYGSSTLILLEPALDFSKIEYLFVLERNKDPNTTAPEDSLGQKTGTSP
ncbi:MAG: rod shape-determining protein MreC [Spirochaetales bacterium]|nr:rod shape-determining protein MreC [Spirochaetales bacterium]